jgi:hypothetical protein
VNESEGSQSNILGEKKVTHLGQQGGVGGEEGARLTVRSFDDREITVVVT